MTAIIAPTMRHLLPSMVVMTLLLGGAWRSQADEAVDADAPVSVASLLHLASDLSALPRGRSWSAHLDSSYDRSGGNRDQQNFVAQDGDTAVLADLQGPGAVVRFWTTSVTRVDGHLSSYQAGMLKIYIDDQQVPVIAIPCGDLFTGGMPPFLPPLTIINGAASYTYLPLPFSRHCRITIDKPTAEFFYQVNSLRFPAGTAVRPFALPLRGDDLEALHLAQSAWAHASRPPAPAADALIRQLTIPAGGTALLPPLAGPGTITSLALAAPQVADGDLRRLILRAWFDGHQIPDIEAPVADFFGNAFGHAQFASLILAQDASGWMSCRLPMPFAEGARIAIENGCERSAAIAVAITSTAGAPAAGSLILHADFNQEITIPGRAHAWASIRGQAGHLVGVVQAMQSARTLGFCEGDDQIRVDAERFVPATAFPTVIAPWNGTGTEDCFNSAWYYAEGIKAQALSACLVKQQFGRIDTFRFFLDDAPVFQQSIDAQIEHGGTNDGAGDYYSSVAFWYGRGGRIPLMAMPAAATLGFPTIGFQGAPLVIEGEALIGTAVATAGTLEVQEMRGLQQVWSGNQQLRWSPLTPGATLTLAFTVATSGRYHIAICTAKGPGYGSVRFAINGEELPRTLDGHGAVLENDGPIELGTAALPAGVSHLTITASAGTPLAASEAFGLDLLALRRD